MSALLALLLALLLVAATVFLVLDGFTWCVERIYSGLVFVASLAPRRKRPAADPEQVARLEAWHQYWHKGCYSGNCEHDDPKRKEDPGLRLFMASNMTTEDFMRLYERKCVLVDRRTKDNRFPYLSEWLSDVDRMLEAGNALVEREPK